MFGFAFAFATAFDLLGYFFKLLPQKLTLFLQNLDFPFVPGLILEIIVFHFLLVLFHLPAPDNDLLFLLAEGEFELVDPLDFSSHAFDDVLLGGYLFFHEGDFFFHGDFFHQTNFHVFFFLQEGLFDFFVELFIVCPDAFDDFILVLEHGPAMLDFDLQLFLFVGFGVLHPSTVVAFFD